MVPQGVTLLPLQALDSQFLEVSPLSRAMEVPLWEGMAPHQVGPLQQLEAILPQLQELLQWQEVTPSNHHPVDILPRPHPLGGTPSNHHPLGGRAVTPSNHLLKHQVATPSSSHHQQLQQRQNQLPLHR